VYHSTTALLPDGRVLSTGSGDGGGVTQQHTYEIYSPPYLFKGARPTYDLGSTSMHYGQTFDVTTPDAASIGKVTLIRLASSTHASDMSQRLNTLSFVPATDGHSITVTPPSAGRIAPPGPYMLFILNQQGVPSSAQVVTLSQ
jgi:galactose oxidase